jgi:hypothetical protein
VFLDIESCKSCGLPLFIGFVGKWENNGVLSCGFLPGGRGIFYESDTINTLTESLEELLGASVEHILIESIRRDVRGFMENFLSMQISQAMDLPVGRKGNEAPREMGVSPEEILELQKLWNLQAITVGRVFGYGDVLLGEGWETGDRHPWRTQVIRNPYSIAAYAAAAIGTVESFEKRDMWADYELIGENTYRIKVYPSSHPEGLYERLEGKGYGYDFKPGDITYERCPECGVPVDIARYRWDLEEGAVIDTHFSRRMALLPPVSIDAFLADLEAELGSDIPEAVIETQRKTIKSYMQGEDWSRSGWTFKHTIGLRGMGNLTYFKADKQRLFLKIENSCMHLLMVGFIQALAELAYGVEGSVREWTLSDDGVLGINITVWPRNRSPV